MKNDKYIIMFDMDFHYHDEPKKQRCERCAIGEYDENNPVHEAWDDQIFYWFTSLEEVLDAYKNPHHFEFQIIKTDNIRIGV